MERKADGTMGAEECHGVEEEVKVLDAVRNVWKERSVSLSRERLLRIKK